MSPWTGWLAAVPALRVLVDLAHGSGLGRLVAGVLGVTMVVMGMASRPLGHPLVRPLAIFAALVLVGAARSVVHAEETARLVLLYLSPPIFAVAVTRHGAVRGPILAAAPIVALVPVLASAAAWCQGQAGARVLHGYPRLVGPYVSLHNHAVAMAIFVTMGLFWAHAGRGGARVAGGLLSGLAGAWLWLTYVRTAELWVLITVACWLAVRGRWRLLVGLASLTAIVIVAHPTLRDRFRDVGSVLTLTPPENGWGAVGSWRFHIWADSWQQFIGRGPVVLFTGLGLGAHRTLHKALDPHNDYLALWYQLGVLGPIAWLWMFGVAIRDATRVVRARCGHEREVAAYAAAMMGGAVLAAGISNDVLPRSLLATWIWTLAGLVWSMDQRSDEGGSCGGDVEGGDPGAGTPPA